MINYNPISGFNNFILLDHFPSLCEERVCSIAFFDRMKHPIAQPYSPAPGCMGFTLYPPWQEGVRGCDHIALHPGEIRYRKLTLGV